jgi:hypothetical protein
MEIEAKAAKPKHAVLTFNFYKMSSLTTFVDCPNLQSRLEDTFCMGASEPLPIIGFLFSPENNAQLLERNAVPTAGKKRIVELVYSRRVLEAEVTNTIDYDTCTSTDKRGETSTTFDIDITKGVQIDKKFDLVDLVTRCENNDMYFARLVSDLIDGAERKMETQAATYLAALAGGFSVNDKDYDDTAVVGSTKIIRTRLSDGSLDYSNGWSQILQTARLNAYCSAPVVIGEYEIGRYFEAIKVGCCANTGIDFASVAQGLPTYLPSYRMTDALASTSKFMALAAGAALPVWFNLYGGANVNVLNDDANVATIVVSRRGIPFDLRVTRDCNSISVVVSLAWDLFSAPSDMFENSDPLDGVNFINKFEISNP